MLLLPFAFGVCKMFAMLYTHTHTNTERKKPSPTPPPALAVGKQHIYQRQKLREKRGVKMRL